MSSSQSNELVFLIDEERRDGDNERINSLLIKNWKDGVNFRAVAHVQDIQS
jgi:hypothetical protein